MIELFSKPAARFIGAAVLAIAVLILVVLGLRELRGMIDDAVALKGRERDSFWTAKIEKSNADLNKRAADQAAAIIRIQSDMADKNRADQIALHKLREQNALLPHGNACGLSGDRVGLLPD
ncbi:hypothetical protein AB4Z13_14450 [Rhizobium sp. YAF28]|uniref:hypothetical protein n=1 Tax=Rhizobium sp. YAF28 TaxID=3233081 RepID=UPI003F96DF66